LAPVPVPEVAPVSARPEQLAVLLLPQLPPL
jgi:hypothetical protein